MSAAPEPDVPIGYPPPHHLLRDLRLEVEHRPDGTASVWLPRQPRMLDADGLVPAGLLALLVDVVGGGVAAIAAAPDWIATADLSLHLTGAGGDECPWIEARAEVLRSGRTTVVLEVGLVSSAGPGSADPIEPRSEPAREGGATGHSPPGERATRADAPTRASAAPGALLGRATMSFSVLARRDTNPVVGDPPTEARRTLLAEGSAGLDEPVLDAIGLCPVDPSAGLLELPMTPYVRNSLGALQGGVAATLADQAAQAALRRACGGPVRTVDVQITYLALARTGPIRTRTDVLAAQDGFGTAHVELEDAGAGGRRTSLARVVAAAPGAGPAGVP